MLKHSIAIVLLLTSLLFVSCVEDASTGEPDIDKSAEQAKELIDQFSSKAKKILENEDNVENVKELVDQLAGTSKELQEHIVDNKDVWEEKINQIKDDPEIQKLLETATKDKGKIIDKLQEILENAEKDIQ